MTEIYASKDADVGGTTVRRALPQRTRRTIGAWCFVDHFGPTAPATTRPAERGIQIGAHPHIGLHTVTWLVEGAAVHTDSLGSEQPLRPGQLNVMTAGRGIAHAEDTPADRHGVMHGAQLWVAQPEATRHGANGFEHHADLPRLAHGTVELTVMVGEHDGQRSPARADTALFGAELRVRSAGSAAGASAVPLRTDFEYGIVVLDGQVHVDGDVVTPGQLAYLGSGRDEIAIGGSATALLLGGEPFPEKLLMWWNFVGRTWDDISAAREAWAAGDTDRFAPVRTRLGTVPAPELPSFATTPTHAADSGHD
jgi:redox-sensitive bicupin YhaK (pirin superfamily)